MTSSELRSDWTGRVGQRLLVRRPPPWNDEPIREVRVAEVTAGGYVRLMFLTVSTDGREEKGSVTVGLPDWYGPGDWVVLEQLPAERG